MSSEITLRPWAQRLMEANEVHLTHTQKLIDVYKNITVELDGFEVVAISSFPTDTTTYGCQSYTLFTLFNRETNEELRVRIPNEHHPRVISDIGQYVGAKVRGIMPMYLAKVNGKMLYVARALKLVFDDGTKVNPQMLLWKSIKSRPKVTTRNLTDSDYAQLKKSGKVTTFRIAE